MTRIFSWNVNGIRSVINKGALQAFVLAYQPDFLCIQETKAKQGQAEIDLPDYTEYWNSADKPGYSGTAIFSKTKAIQVINGFSAEIIEEYQVNGDIFGDPNREGRVLAAEFTDFWLVSIYTPNAKRELSRLDLRHKNWDPAVLAHIKMLEKTKPVIMCGDLNVAHTPDDLANPKSNTKTHGFTPQERAGFQNFIESGFIDSFRIFTKGNGHYSWWSHFAKARERNIGWRIDYILASKNLLPKIKNAQIHAAVLGSDHCPISLELDL